MTDLARMHPVRLRFRDDALESEFLDDHARRSMKQYRAGTFASAAMILIIYPWAATVVPSVKQPLAWVLAGRSLRRGHRPLRRHRGLHAPLGAPRPEQLVAMLNEAFTAFDRIAEKHGLEKIKTIGDAYTVAGGIPVARADHAEAIADMAIEMRDTNFDPGHGDDARAVYAASSISRAAARST